eukprot:6770379-Heterocapsa_arctica.AAC.1
MPWPCKSQTASSSEAEARGAEGKRSLAKGRERRAPDSPQGKRTTRTTGHAPAASKSGHGSRSAQSASRSGHETWKSRSNPPLKEAILHLPSSQW